VHLQGDSINWDALCHESGDQVVKFLALAGK
jgi:hypothetical protein